MKNKKTRILGLILAFIMFISNVPLNLNVAHAAEGDITIDSTHFKDPAFRQYLRLTYGRKTRNILKADVRNSITELDLTFDNRVKNKNLPGKIMGLEGIEYFPNLKILRLDNNMVFRPLDLTKNTNLERLYMSENKLSSLRRITFADKSKIRVLDLSKNNFATLDTTGFTNLESLNCEYQQQAKLSSLKVGSSLTQLNCSGNSLNVLDLSKNTKLNDLDCSSNQLTSLKLRTNLTFAKNSDGTEKKYLGNQIYTLPNNPYPDLIRYDSFKPALDPTKVENLVGATKESEGFRVNNSDITEIKYKYNCGPANTYLDVTLDRNTQVKIDSTNFPDPTFREYIKSEFDKNKDGSLSKQELNDITVIRAEYDNEKKTLNHFRDKNDLTPRAKIQTAKGIELFPNLVRFDADRNNISSIDLRKNPKLEILWLGSNNISNLSDIQLANNDTIEMLALLGNKLTTLDVRHFKNLWFLRCDDQQSNGSGVKGLESLKVGPKVKLLRCNDNRLTELDLINNKELFDLDCSWNRLTALDLDPSVKFKVENGKESKWLNNQEYEISIARDWDFCSYSRLPGNPNFYKITAMSGGGYISHRLSLIC